MSITKEKLEEMYSNMTSKELCKKLGCSYPTMRNLIRDAGIPLKGRGSRPKKIQIVGVE